VELAATGEIFLQSRIFLIYLSAFQRRFAQNIGFNRSSDLRKKYAPAIDGGILRGIPASLVVCRRSIA
jgi:hypothetical protein